MPYKRTALVTGANRGIGREVVRQLALKDWRVYLAARSEEKGKAAAEDLEGLVIPIAMDVTDEDSIQRAANSIERLDVLVNNAGIYPDVEHSVLEVGSSDLSAALETNTIGPLMVSQKFWPLLLVSGHARIINVSSGYGQLQDMTDEQPAYCISKTALNAVTRQLSGAGRRCSIAVNSVCPGWVRTGMGGESAPRSVEEGADTIVWLATEAPQELTGKFLRDRRPIPW